MRLAGCQQSDFDENGWRLTIIITAEGQIIKKNFLTFPNCEQSKFFEFAVTLRHQTPPEGSAIVADLVATESKWELIKLILLAKSSA